MTTARTRERLIQRLVEQGIRDPRVLDRIRNVPRHLFVDEALASRAYEDTALPIGHGQTISQPYVVARMTEAITDRRHAGQGPRDRDRLRLPDGGARAARRAALQHRAHRGAARAGARAAEGARHPQRPLQARRRFEGWPSQAPFDGILVAAAPHALPQKLLDQLAEGGRLIVPVGPEGRQEFLRLTRRGDQFLRERLGFVSFVPLLGGVT